MYLQKQTLTANEKCSEKFVKLPKRCLWWGTFFKKDEGCKLSFLLIIVSATDDFKQIGQFSNFFSNGSFCKVYCEGYVSLR